MESFFEESTYYEEPAANLPQEDGHRRSRVREARVVESRVEELLSSSAEVSNTWIDLVQFLRRRCHILWMSRNVCITFNTRRNVLNDDDRFECCGSFSLEYDEVHEGWTYFSALVFRAVSQTATRSTAELQTETAGFQRLFRLMAKKRSERVKIRSGNESGLMRGVLHALKLPADALTYFLSTNSNHKELKFNLILFSEDQSQSLANWSGSIEVSQCSLLMDDGRSIIAAIGRNHGPTELCWISADIDRSSLCNALARTQTLRKLSVQFMTEYYHALGQNQSLIELELYEISVSVEEFESLFQSLRTNTTLRKLTLGMDQNATRETAETRKARALAILELLQVNRTLCRLNLGHGLVDQQIWHAQILPRLQANLYRQRLSALLEETDQSLRAKLFAKALVYEQINSGPPTLMWMFVSRGHALISELHDSLDQKEPASKRRRDS